MIPLDSQVFNSPAEELDACYLEILYRGLLNIRNGAGGRNHAEYCSVEADHLHNIPSLIGETNRDRHTYYYHCERPCYLSWLKKYKREQVSHWYEEVWKRMAKIIGPDPNA